MSKKKEKQQDVNTDEIIDETNVSDEDTDSSNVNEPVEKEKCEESLKSNNDIEDKFYRLLADFDNYKKRSSAEKDNLYGLAVADTVAAILPAIDNLERALLVAEDSSLKKGVEMVLSQIYNALQKMNIDSYGEVGDIFDPTLHEAIMHIEDDSYESGAIVEVLQKGFKNKNKIIRYALVKVAN